MTSNITKSDPMQNMHSIQNIIGSKIGLLGGSFNPPHSGHINISLRVLKKFNLSRVYWLVTPCSPHKYSDSYESLERRIEKCLQITKNFSNKIKVLDIEKNQRTYFSSDTLQRIKRMNPDFELYWIIGCDNLLSIHKWHKWKRIFEISHIVVCERNDISLKIMNLKASFNFNPNYISNQDKIDITKKDFSVFHMKRDNISSTDLRGIIKSLFNK